MKHQLHFLILAVILIWATYGLYAQQGFVAFGGEATGSGGGLSITGGRIDFEYYSSAHGSLSLGIQQSWPDFLGIPPVLEIPNTIIGSGELFCYNATQTIIVAGDGKLFIVQNGGHSDIIAGQNILLKPGTTVQSGGSLHAFISTDWCDDSKTIVSAPEERLENYYQSSEPDASSSFFKVFPNPTSGNLTLELLDSKEFSKLQIEIYSAQGNLVLETKMQAAKHYNLNLSNKQPGIYLLRVLRDSELGTSKIIKY